MRKSNQTRPSGNPIPVRFTPEQVRHIEETAQLLGMSKQDVIRMAVVAGAKTATRAFGSAADAESEPPKGHGEQG